MALVPDNRWTDPTTGLPTNIPFAGAAPQFKDDGTGRVSFVPGGVSGIEEQADLLARATPTQDSGYDGIYPGEPASGLSLAPPTGGLSLIPVAPAAIGVIVTVSALIARFGLPAMQFLIRGLQSIGIPIGSRLSWSAIPAAIRAVLVGLGVVEGSDLLFDTDGEGADRGLIPLPIFGGGGTPSGTPPPPEGDDAMTKLVRALFVGGWFAQSVAFYRLSDGRLAVRNKKGVWKIWRPKKPIVIMPTGMSNIKDILRADRVIDRQSEAMAKMLRRRGKQVRSKVNPKDSSHEGG